MAEGELFLLLDHSKFHSRNALSLIVYLIISFHSKRGDRISELKGCIGEMSHEQQRAILVEGKNDYSVQYSTSKRKCHLWLGPAAFLNHGNLKNPLLVWTILYGSNGIFTDCKPNAKIQSTGNHSASVYAIADIKNDDEILIFYGKDFFEVGNTECECRTCER